MQISILIVEIPYALYYLNGYINSGFAAAQNFYMLPAKLILAVLSAESAEKGNGKVNRLLEDVPGIE